MKMKKQYEKFMFSEDFHNAGYEKRWIFDLLEMVISFLCSYSLFASFIFIGTIDQSKIYSGIPMLLTVTAMCFVKRKIKDIYKFTIAAVFAAIVTIALIYSSETAAYYILFLLGYLIYYIRKHRSNETAFFTITKLVMMNILMGFTYGFSLLYKAPKLQKLLLVISILHILLSLVYYCLSSSEKVLYWESYEDEKYRKNLSQINLMLLAVLVLLFAFVIIFSFKIGVFKELDYLYGYILNSIIKFPMPNRDASDTQYANDILNQSKLLNFAQDNHLTGDSYSILWYIFIIILIAAGIFLLMLAAVGVIMVSMIIIQIIYRNLFIKNGPGENREFMTTKEIVNENLERVKGSLKIVKKTLYKSNKERIRGIYERLIIKYINKGLVIEKSHTPSEIESSIKTKYNDEFSKATELYEKARYSDEDIKDEDVNALRKML
ncbi:hypothetical protein HMPREF1982_00705 [Clostridiales bacterium oral taxon 876 str. F0540]|nr:hypothetical protein HMPREF1982_00705 [Clostridiales bacterium oral taxon 876 str. F0540]